MGTNRKFIGWMLLLSEGIVSLIYLIYHLATDTLSNQQTFGSYLIISLLVIKIIIAAVCSRYERQKILLNY